MTKESELQLPNLVIIGAMKSATSSLHQYLNLHPQIQMSGEKELDFFIEEKNWHRGLDWYRSHLKAGTKIVGESSPNYTKSHIYPGVPERMYELIPNAKLIYILRHPIKRIISHHFHLYVDRCEHRKLNYALSNLEDNHYVKCSYYATQIEQYLQYYPLSQILIISSENLAKKRIETLQKIFKFLEVDCTFSDPKFSQFFHQSSQKKRLTNFGDKIARLPSGMRVVKLIPNLMEEVVVREKICDSTYTELSKILKREVERLEELTNFSPAWEF